MLVVGAAYFPMALLGVVIYDDLAALNPIRVIVSVARTAPRYLALCLCLGAIAGLVLGAEAFLQSLGRQGLALAAANAGWMYLSFVLARATGWFYYRSKDQLAWD